MTKQISINDMDLSDYDILSDNEIVIGKFGNVKLPYDKIEQLILSVMVKTGCKTQIGFTLKQFIELLNENQIGYQPTDKQNKPKRLGNVVQTFRNANKNELFGLTTHSYRGEYIVFAKTSKT